MCANHFVLRDKIKSLSLFLFWTIVNSFTIIWSSFSSWHWIMCSCSYPAASILSKNIHFMHAWSFNLYLSIITKYRYIIIVCRINLSYSMFRRDCQALVSKELWCVKTFRILQYTNLCYWYVYIYCVYLSAPYKATKIKQLNKIINPLEDFSQQ